MLYSEYMKKKEEEEKKKAQSSNSSLYSNMNYSQYKKAQSFGFDTLESDLHTMGETLNNIYGSWQTKETMDNTFESVNKMYNRLVGYQDYYTQYGKESGLPDLSELLNTYKNAVDKWGERTELYGNYQNADAFNKAVKDYQLSEKFKGLSYGDVQALMRKYSSDPDAYNYLKNYTGYTSVEDFDKAIAGLSTDIGMFDKANEYEGRISSYEGQADKFKKRTNGLTNDGGYGKKADETRAEYDAWLKENGFDSGNALKAEYADEVKLAKELGKAKNIYELDNSTADKYKYLEQNEDFAEHSQYDSSVNEGKKPHYQPFTNYDIKYDYINNVPEIRDSYERKAGNKDAGTAFSDNGWEYLTEKELAYYNYLHYLDGQNGTKKSDKFLEDLKPALQKRYSEKASERREEMLENPFMATAFSLVSPIMTMAGGIGNLMATGKDIVTGSEYNPYDPLREISNANAQGREVVSQNIAEATKGFELFGQNIASFLYNTGESVLDTVVGGSAFGHGYTALMGTNAYQQKAKELTEQGYDTTTVQGLAITSGVLEMAFEYAGFDHLMKLKDADSIGKVIYNALVSQGGAEGLEELGTSIGNMMAEYGFLGEDSQYMKQYNDLIARGFSEKEASTEVAKAMASEIGWSFAGGWLSGVGLGAGTSVGQYTQNKAVGKSLRGAEQIGDVLNIASMTPQESEAYKAYTAYANKGVTADNITDAQLGNLYNTMSGEAKGGFRTAVTDLANAHGEMTTQRTTLGYEYESAKKDMLSAKAEIDTLKGIIDSKESTEVQKASASADLDNAIAKYNEAQQRMNRAYEPAVASESLTDRQRNKAQNKLDKAVSEYTDAQTRFGKYAPIADKLSGVEESVGAYNAKRTIEKAEAEKRAKHEAEVKKLSSGVETSVMADTDKAIEIKGMKDSDTLITSDGEVKLKDVELSDRDADLVAYARGMEASEASLYLEQYKGEENIEEYTNTFSLVTSMAKNNYSEDAILKAKGSLSTEQFNAIYAATVTERYREKQRNIDKLNAEMAGKMSYKGVIDDSVINYGNKTVKGKVKWSDLNSRQREAITFVSGFAKATGMNLKFIADGEKRGINGSYDKATNTITIDVHAGISKAQNLFKDTIIPTMSHETTHWMKEKSPELYRKMGDLIFKTLEARDKISEVDRIASEVARQKAKGKNITDDGARDEIIARACEDMLKMSEEGKKYFNSLSESEKKTFIDKVKEILANLMEWVDNLLNSYSSDRYEAKVMREYKDTLAELSKMWDEMLVSSVKNNSSMELAGVWKNANEATQKVGVGIDAKTKSAYPMEQFSERTWSESEYVQNRDVAVKALVKAIGVTEADAKRYIDNINSIARLIADDRVRLDYDSNMDATATVLKSNSEYKWTLDMSTLCAKRLLTTGTFDAIQKALPNTVFNSEDIVHLREMMMERGYEVACGICYVESTRRELGPITEEFINRYKEAQKTGKPIQRINSEKKYVDLKKTKEQMLTTADKSSEFFYADKNYTPTLAELNTTDIDLVKRDHPLVYEAYLNFMNARGQAKPKLLETRAEYRGDILKHFNKSAVNARNAAGGLRVQSFSDFEIAHLIDMMQAVLDMSRVGLKSQAYTKVPAFADVFGGTGMKINLSLIAKGSGLDENGNLIFDDIEGINHKEAFRLREKYSKNVGTILVGKTDAHIIAAMADPRIDFIIPFHKSSWKESLYEALGLQGYNDYTETQNEKPIDEGRKIKNFQPSEYWDYSKSGDENAQIYLAKCKEDGRIPKFPQFQGYPGYWKLLIDFKMYDNDGIGSPQEVVRPDFDMESANDILNSYEGGHRSFPVAQDVVKDFVAEYKKNHPMDDGDVLVQNDDRDDAFIASEFTEDDYKQNCKALVQMNSVADLIGTELDGDLPLKQKIGDLFASWGGVLRTKRFGNVDVKESSIRSDIRHGSTRNKITAYAAIPQVINEGVVIDVLKKNHGEVERIVIAAPITISNTPYFMGVMIQKADNSNRLYLHDVVIKKEVSEYQANHLNTTGSIDTENLLMTEVLEKAISVGYIVSQSNEKSNEQIVNNDGIQNSDRDDDISVYEKLGDLDRVLKERDILKEDIQRLHERLKLEGKVTNGKYFTDSSILNVAGFLLKKVDSKYDKVELAKRLKSLYHGMTTNTKVDSDALWSEVLEIANDIALMAKPKTVKNDYAMNLLKEIKGTRVRFNSNQKAEAKARFGANWNRSFFGKIILADNANMELDEQWKVWAEEHPDIFDAHVKDSDQPMELYDILTTLKEQSEIVEEYNKEEFVQYIATEILGATWNLKPIVTTADKYTAKIKEIRSEHKQAMKNVRDAYNARVDESRLAERMFYGKKMSEMRKEYDAKLEKQRKTDSAKMADKLAEAKEQHEAKIYEKELAERMFYGKKMSEMRKEYDAKLEKQRKTDSAKMADKLAETREQHEAELYEKELAERMHFGAEIAKLRRQKDEKVAEAKELGKQRMAEYKENIARKTILQSTMGTVTSLNKKLTTNSKDVHIPDSVKPVVIKLLNAIDFSSKQLLGISEAYRELHGTPTAKDISLENTFSKVHSMETGEADAGSLKRAIQDALKLFQNAGDVLKGTSDGTVDSSVVALDKDMVDDIEKMIEDIDILIEKGETTFVLQKMSTESLKTLNGIVKSINHWAIVADKALANKHKNRISELGMQTIAETDKYGKRQEYIKDIEDVKNFFNWSNLLPVNAFKRLGDAATEFFNGLRDSQDKVTFNRQEVMDFTDELLKKYKAYNPLNWRTEVKTFDVKLPGETDATKVTMPVSYIMTLYCVAKQEDAQRHLYGKDENGNKLTYTDEKGNVHDGGGMTIKGFKEGKLTLKVNKSLDNTIVNESIVKQITSVLTKEQIEVADALQKYMNDKGSEWGNAVSMALYGIKKFAVKDYFPLTVSPHTLSADKIRDVKASFFSILNYGFTKERNPNAKQSIEIGDIFEVFANHMNMLSIYNAYALSVFDIARWYNFKGKNENGKEISVTASIEKAFGKGALTYVSNLIKDLNGQHEPSRLGFISEMFKRAKVAMVGNSISVALLQPTAYLKAMVKIPPKYLLKSALHIKDFGASNGVRKAKKYCGIALLKSQGYFETGVSANTATKMMHDESLKEKLTEWSLKGAEWMDERTWGALWNACEFMIRDARKDLKVGSEEFYHAVADKLRDVIYETQVVDSPLTKSDLMRSGDTGAKMVTMFASEMTVAYNMVFESAFQTHLDSKRYGLTNALKKNAKNLYMTFMAYTLTSVANAALSTFVDSFRYGGDDDEEDENEFLKNFLSDWFIIGKIPYFKEIISFSQGYSSSRTDTLWLESMFKAYKYWKKAAEGKDGATMKAFDESLKTVSYISGTAVYNQWRDLRAMLKFIGIME